MQAEEQQAKTFQGHGRLRSLATGESILLEDHPAHAGQSEQQRTFVVTGIDLQLRNNTPEAWKLPSSVLEQAGFGDVAEGSEGPSVASASDIQLRFSAVHRDVPLVPRYAGTFDRPTANGPQTATVVGPAGKEVFTDALGRIRIQFHWQRPDEHAAGTAASNERSSTWVRVAMPSAGDGFGHQFVPRIGQEVLVAFLHNDIDRPVVVATLYNGQHATPGFSGRRGLPGNCALSGIQSREHHGQDHSELLMDDTPGQVRARLATTPFASELNLGKLTTPRVDGQAQLRGDGAELRTDAALALRAAHGILITSYARELACGGQLDRQELLTLLDDCGELFRGLGHAATNRGARQSSDEGMTHLQGALTEWPEAGDQAGEPVVAIAGDGGIISATPQSQLHYAGRNHDVVATDHMQSVSGGVTHLQAGAGMSLYAQDGGIKAIANRGDVIVQAQDADIALNAQKFLHASAGEGEVLITAPTIRLVADDGSYIRIGSGIEIGTQGDVKLHAVKHDWLGPKTDSVTIPAFGRDPAARQHRFHYEGDVSSAVSNIAYKLALSDGSLVEGISTAAGTSERVERDEMQRVVASVSQELLDAAAGALGRTAPAAPTHTDAYDLTFLLKDEITGEPLSGIKYRVQLESGDVVVGTTDSEGLTRVIHSNTPQIARIEAPYDDECTADTHPRHGSDACSC